MALKSIEALVAEHQATGKVLAELEGLLDDFLAEDVVPAESRNALKGISNFLSNDLTVHIKKEDEGLFPLLGKFLPHDAGPLAVMLDEHSEIAERCKGLQRGVTELQRDPSTHGSAAANVRDSGRLLIKTFRRHIYKEENVLFPFAESHLGAGDDREVVRRFEEIASGAPGQ